MDIVLSLLFLVCAYSIGAQVLLLLPIQFLRSEQRLTSVAMGLVVLAELVSLMSLITHEINFVSISSAVLVAMVFVWLLRRHNTHSTVISERLPLFSKLALVIFGGYIISTLWFRILLPDGQGNLTVGPPALYGDTALHASYTSRIAYGPFPPENAIFAGIPLVYPFMIHIQSAIFLRLGLSWHLAFWLPQVFFTLAFVVLFAKLARTSVTKGGEFIAACLFFLGSGIGFYYFLIEKLQGVSFLEFSHKYGDLTHTNELLNLNLHNFITGMILPERTFLPGLFLGVLLTLLIKQNKVLSWRLVLPAAVILGILPFWHTHTFLLFGGLIGYWFLVGYNGRLKEKIKYLSIFYVVALILAIPFVVMTLSQVDHGSFVRVISGWMNKGENLVSYWLRNSFLIIPLAVVGWLQLKRGDKWFFLPTFGVFILANIISLSPLDWDNIKLFSWVILFWSILAAGWLVKLLQKKNLLSVVSVLLIIFSCLSGALALRIPWQEKFVLYDAQDIELAEWARSSTPRDSVFLTEATHNHPIAGLSGRPIYIGYPGFLWVHGIDFTPREELVKQFYGGDMESLGRMQPAVSYIVYNQWQTVSPGYAAEVAVFQNTKYKVYKAN